MDKPLRTLVIGDIHGHLIALEHVVKLAGLRPDDLLITLGDYVDRGPDSKGVLDWLIERDKVSARRWRSQAIALLTTRCITVYFGMAIRCLAR